MRDRSCITCTPASCQWLSYKSVNVPKPYLRSQGSTTSGFRRTTYPGIGPRFCVDRKSLGSSKSHGIAFAGNNLNSLPCITQGQHKVLVEALSTVTLTKWKRSWTHTEWETAIGSPVVPITSPPAQPRCVR
eukprot:3060141-Amphidinium_carterae.2